ncbi:MAG: DNA-processing protein DprA [Desulfocapsa sp.]|nr:DNA-processing protein DprA [Desulfocapsa sp.]
MSDSPVIDWMALSFVPGLGGRGVRRIISRFGTPAAVFSACKKGLGGDTGIRKDVAAILANPAPFREKALSHLQRLRTGGAEAICPDDDIYPQLLSQIADPPPVLYVQGHTDLLFSSCVAIVGSRAATAYGRRSGFSLARDLANAGVTVVSGLAAGIDGEAHSGALSAQGGTIAVLGCGLDVVYPRQNSGLYEQIRKDGLLVSEYPLGTRPDGFRFPARNRIIAGMSRGVVVVEAAKKSGSLITAEMALDEGREVFAVPGQIDSFKSGGTHWLLQQGAKLVQSAEDILVELGGRPGKADFESAGQSRGPEPDIDPDARKLLQAIDVYPCSRNELIAATTLGPAKVGELLLLLELEGLVEVLPGDEIRRIN